MDGFAMLVFPLFFFFPFFFSGGTSLSLLFHSPPTMMLMLILFSLSLSLSLYILQPYNNVMVTNSSFRPTGDPLSHYASAFLFPAFKYIPRISVSPSPSSSAVGSGVNSNPTRAGSPSEDHLTTFVRAALLPKDLHPAHESLLPASRQAELIRAPELLSAHFDGVIDIKQSPTILICGHGGRDMRCGIMGPVLLHEFERVLREKGFHVPEEEPSGFGQAVTVDGPGHANVGLISHIGGHKYAGNVIIYIPPELKVKKDVHDGDPHLYDDNKKGNNNSSFIPSSPSAAAVSPNSSASSSTPNLLSSENTTPSITSPLAGTGIWYGRIEPGHVEGIVEETIFRGRVVADHFRGGVGMAGEIYRL